MMPFRSRVFQLAKDPERPQECQDAWRIDPARGLAAVADGVTSTLFARHWAEILVEAAVTDPPEPDDAAAFAHWLARRRQTWTAQIDTTGLAWFQKAKLPLGAFSTLLWVRVLPADEDRPGEFGAYRLQSWAAGDSCLLQLRGNEIVRTFPVQTAAELQADPVAMGSVDLGRDHLVRFASLDAACYPDDVLLLCTDAVADWALRRTESGDPPAWDEYWSLTHAQWREEIVRLRDQQQMRYDDATLLLLRVVPEGVAVGPVDVEPGPVAAEVVPGIDPNMAADEDWKGKLRSAGTQMVEGIELASDQVVRGVKKWKQRAVQKYRQRFRRDRQEPRKRNDE